MGLAQVWNDNVHPYKEVFKEKTIQIAPKSFIEMDFDEAKEFKSQYSPIVHDGEGNPLPTSYKMIRVVPLKQDQRAEPLICHATGKIASSPEELAKMNAEHAGILEESSKKHVDEMAKMRAELDELRARNSELEAKRGPGRPKKEQTA